MADTSQSQRQQQTKVIHDSRNLLEKLTAWDTKNDPKAPLTDKQKDSFMELTTQWSNRSLPIELPVSDMPIVHPRVTQRTSDDDAMAASFAKFKQESIDNAQQFFLWFSEVEKDMRQEEEEEREEFITQLDGYRGKCRAILDEVSQALSHLSELRHSYLHVSMKTNALHEACENLLQEQSQLVSTVECMESRLSYFNELDTISGKLGGLTMSMNNDSFIPMLTRLDECIAHLNKNNQYKEHDVYLARFRQCLSKALGLVRTNVSSILVNATKQVLPKKELPTTHDDAFTMFYGKFRTNAPKVKAIIAEIEERLDKSPQYEQLLRDCHQCYFQQRELLLGSSVSAAIADLASKHQRDHCAMMRSGSAFMVHVCEDEHQLFSHFFMNSTPLLEQMLEGLCHKLYDVFRPLIIHVNHLETLAELCSILKIEMLEERVLNNPHQLQAFETVCSQMLEDAQERLVFRTHIYIRQEILGYQPAAGDLAYPEKLQMMENIAESIRNGELNHNSTPTTPTEGDPANQKANNEVNKFVTISLHGRRSSQSSVVSNMPMSPADLHGMWYPTVRRMLVCLSKLYRCVDKSAFQGLSQETLFMCIQSLLKANESISKNKTPLDGQLFLIKHLLIMREQIAPFQVDFAITEMALDFSKFKDAAMGLLYSKSKIFALNNSNAILHFLLESTPQAMETAKDSKRAVDHQLKTTCEEFIAHVTTKMIAPLQAFLAKASVIVNMSSESEGRQVSLRSQPFASAERVQEVVSETYRALKKRKASVQRSMSLYLANRDTEYILFKPIKGNVQQSFQQLWKLLADHYTQEDQQIIGCPTVEQINLLLASGASRSRHSSVSSTTTAITEDVPPPTGKAPLTVDPTPSPETLTSSNPLNETDASQEVAGNDNQN